ncbi:phosphatase PAP2 family protein [Robiginitalea sp. IMCC44478]|uniref:phosphatase PAP2 family protein n=1 Tax=Robiginitalea sp. IMCC44478 TaxID=3459122 RepID=UPI0040412DEA
MWDAIIEKDRELFLYLNSLGTPAWDGFWLFLSDKWAAIPLYLLLLVISFRRLGWKNTLVFLIFIALLITVCDQLANFFKYGVARLRPCHDPDLQSVLRLVKASCGGRYGYFSAHAANAMGLATFFCFFLGKAWRWFCSFLIIWALAVGFSRIYLGVHYPLDVVSGALAGSFFGWLFYRLYTFASLKFAS